MTVLRFFRPVNMTANCLKIILSPYYTKESNVDIGNEHSINTTLQRGSQECIMKFIKIHPEVQHGRKLCFP